MQNRKKGSPIDGYHAEIKDARGAAEDVDAGPKVAHRGTEGPLAFDLVEHSHGHDQQGDAQVAHGKTDQQVVAGLAQLFHQEHGHADEYVANNRAYDDATEYQTQQQCLSTDSVNFFYFEATFD